METEKRKVRAFVGATVMVVALSACGNDGTSAPKTSSLSTSSSSLHGAITVSAASSLSGAFERIRQAFTRAHSGTTVEINTGSSAALVTQIEQGARADVFASADTTNMTTLVDAKRTVGPPVVIAHNRLAIVTKLGNSRRIRTLADLSKGPVIALCAGTVPCGKYAAQVLMGAGVVIPESSVTRQADAQATVGAVANGDADAAIVYLTDARAAGGAVATVPIPTRENVVATYPAAALTGGSAPKVARAFVAFLRSASGQQLLRGFGFLPA